MKIIFLDFDGVLNSSKYFYETHEKIKEFALLHHNDFNDLNVLLERRMLDIDVNKLAYLIRIIRKTHAKVVVTSSWKIEEVFPKICDRLIRIGVPIIGVTSDDGINRGFGIKTFLEENDVKNYIILDDDIFPDYDEELLDHLIKTSFYEDGLTEELMQDAINKLNERVKVKKKRNIL